MITKSWRNAGASSRRISPSGCSDGGGGAPAAFWCVNTFSQEMCAFLFFVFSSSLFCLFLF